MSLIRTGSEPPDVTVIQTPRLDLIPLSRPFIERRQRGDVGGAQTILGLEIRDTWPHEQTVLSLRRTQLIEDPALLPWLTRAIGRRSDRRMIGVAGFHGQPGGAHLREWSPNAVEFGYEVFEPYRRQGFAEDACRALLRWGKEQDPTLDFILSIAPDNSPSLRLARKLGFTRTGQYVHPERGLETLYQAPSVYF